MKSFSKTPSDFFKMCIFVALVMYGPFITQEFYHYKKTNELQQLSSRTVIQNLSSRINNLSFIQKEAVCLAQNIYFEAGNQSTKGREAVAAVTLNRVKDQRFPKTTCGVVFQNNKNGCQFSWTCDNKPDVITNEKVFGEALSIAQDFLTGRKSSRIISTDVVYYHADYVKPKWAEEKKFAGAVGAHVFYR